MKRAGTYRITEAGFEPALPLIQRMALPVNKGRRRFATNRNMVSPIADATFATQARALRGV
jgi:hypothetical protein